jgi:uncharacterized membrane protein YbhN (UPF0104 family)
MKRTTRGILGVAVACLLLWLVFRGTDAAQLGHALRRVHLGWLLLAQALLWAACFARVQRWSYVVRAVQPASFRSLLSATQIGLLVNFAVPARLGEVARAFVLSRLVRLPVARAMGMVALDRVNDVVGLLAVVGVAAAAVASNARVEIPAGAFGNRDAWVVSSELVRPAAVGLALLVGAALAGLVFLYQQQDRVIRWVHVALGRLSAPLAERTERILTGFAEGLHVFRSRSDLGRSLLWSLGTWGADVASLAATLVAFDVAFPWHAPFLMLALIGVAVAVPVTPGVVGQFHLPAVAGLLLAAPSVAPAEAKAVAIVDHLATLVPIAVLGLHALAREQIGLGDLLRRSAREDRALHEGARGAQRARGAGDPAR